MVKMCGIGLPNALIVGSRILLCVPIQGERSGGRGAFDQVRADLVIGQQTFGFRVCAFLAGTVGVYRRQTGTTATLVHHPSPAESRNAQH